MAKKGVMMAPVLDNLVDPAHQPRMKTRAQSPSLAKGGVCVELNGGLGNQMYQYAMGKALAHQRQVPLFVDTRLFEGYFRPFELDRFQVDYVPLTPEQGRLLARLAEGKWVDPLRRLRHGLPLLSAPYGLCEQDEDYDDQVCHLPGGNRVIWVQGYWQSWRYFEPVRETIQQAFRLKTPPSPEAGSLLRQLEGRPTVALHIRRGDYLQLQNVYAMLGVDYYEACLQRLWQHHPDAQPWLFSDDPEWVAQHFPVAQWKAVIAKQDCPGLSTLDEFVLMQHCRHQIIGNSTFSCWAAWLNANPDKQVFAPARWFAQRPIRPEDRFPPGWHVME